MNNDYLEIRDFILDWKHVESGFLLMGIEAIITALIIGMVKHDLGIGIISFVAITVLFMIPIVGGILVLAYSLVESILIGTIVMNFSNPLAAWIVAIIAFFFLVSLHYAIIKINDEIKGYSLMLFEVLFIAFVLYVEIELLPVSIIFFVIATILAFIPIVRYIESIALSLFTASGFYYIALGTLNQASALGIAGFVFLYSIFLHILAHQKISWSGIAQNRKNQNDLIEFNAIKNQVYESYPELEKEFYYFKTHICQDDFERVFFESDWNSYINYLHNAQQMIEFNTWFEENKLYKYRNYNRDFAEKYAERRKRSEESANDTNSFNHNQEQGSSQNASIWFAGVSGLDELKKRYRDLLKIYHPDNFAGDTSITQQIQAEYDKYLQEFN